MADTTERFEVIGDDGGSFDALGVKLEAALERGLSGATREMSAELRKVTSQIAAQFRKMNLEGDIRGAARAARDLGRAMGSSSDVLEDIRRDAEALRRTIAAQAQTKNAFIDPAEFALLNRSIEKLQAFQARSRLIDPTDTAEVRKLRLEFGALSAEATKAKAEVQSSTRSLTSQGVAELRRQQAGERQAQRERLVELQKASSTAKFIAQREQQAILSDVQRSNARRVQLTRFMFESLGRLERGLGTVIQGTARAATRGIARIYQDTLGRVSALFTRNSQTIRNITKSTSDNRLSILRSSYSREERLLEQSMSRQTQIIQRQQQQAQTGVIGAARRTSLLGLGGGLAGAGFLTAGFQRFSEIEALQRQFEALTGSATDAERILQEVRVFAKQTPFDVTGVATLAKGFLAMKTPLDQVLPRVRLLADAVALTGGNADSLERIQRALGQVISAGRLQGDELNQLAENLPGLNIRQILADQITGGDVRALNDLQEAGEISADAFINGILGGLAADTRLTGASEDLAKTLGGRFANLEESFQDTAASVIGLFADQLKLAMQGAEIALSGVSSFIKGEVGPAFQVLRTAIGGAAIAIGGLLVAKVAGEALQLLAGSARLLLTPFGAIVAVVGGLGAAFAIMRDRSEEFRDVTDRIGRLLRTTVGRVFESIGDTIERVRDAFSTASEPIIGTADALERASKPAQTFITTIGRKFADAIATAGRFLTDTFIPAIGDAAIFIGRNLGPAIEFVREQIGNLARIVGTAATGAFEKLRPHLESARGILGEVADAIRAVVSGASSLTGLLPAAGAALAGGLAFGPVGALVGGLATGIATLSPTLRNAIVEGVKGAAAGIREVFNGIDWGGLAVGALDFVNRVGFYLGRIATDRRTVTALLAIAGTAAAVALKFVQGFVAGVIDNLPSLVDLGLDMGEAFLGGFGRAATLGIGVLLAGVGISKLLNKQFRILGSSSAIEFAKGFRGNLSRGQDFLASAFGFNANNFRRQSAQMFGQLRRDLDNELRRLNAGLSRSALSGGVVAASGFGGRATTQDIEDARRRMAALNETIGAGATAGLRFRGAISDAFTSIRNNQAGIRGIFSSIGQGLGDARAAIRGQGAAIGTALGLAVTGGFASAMGGATLAGGNVAGGLGQILLSSLVTGLAIGGGAGAVVGALVGGIGLATAAIKASGEAAKAAKVAIAGYRDIFLEAARAGQDAAPKLVEEIFNTLIDLAPDVRAALVDVGVTAEDVFAFAGMDANVREAFGKATKSINDLADVTRGTKTEQIELQEAIDATGRVTDDAARGALERLIQAYKDGTISGDTLAAAVDALKNTTFNSAEAARQAGIDIKLLGDAGEKTSGQLAPFSTLFENLRGHVDNARTAFSEAGRVAEEELKVAVQNTLTEVDKLLNPSAGTLQVEMERAIGALQGIGTQLEGGLQLEGILGGAEVETALRNLRESATSVIKQGLQDGLTESQIDDNLRLLQGAVDELDLSPEAKAKLAAELQAAIDADIPELPTPTFDAEAVRDRGRDMGAVAKSGVEEVGFSSVGGEAASGFARGMTSPSAFAGVTAAAGRLARAAVQTARSALRISSPSRVFMGLGSEVAEGFSLGIINNLGFVTTAGARMSAELISATKGALDDLNAEIAANRESLFSRLLGGTSGLDSARRGIQSALTGLTEGLAGPIREALESGVGPNLRFDIAGGNENRSTLAGVVDQIKSLTLDLMESGATPQQAVAEALKARAQALDIAAFLGFDRAGVDSFFTALGLSAKSLETFTSQLLTDTQRLKTEAEQREFDRLKQEREQEQQDRAGGGVNIGEMIFNLPYAQPEAIALAVANRVARSV